MGNVVLSRLALFGLGVLALSGCGEASPPPVEPVVSVVVSAAPTASVQPPPVSDPRVESWAQEIIGQPPTEDSYARLVNRLDGLPEQKDRLALLEKVRPTLASWPERMRTVRMNCYEHCTTLSEEQSLYVRQAETMTPEALGMLERVTLAVDPSDVQNFLAIAPKLPGLRAVIFSVLQASERDQADYPRALITLAQTSVPIPVGWRFECGGPTDDVWIRGALSDLRSSPTRVVSLEARGCPIDNQTLHQLLTSSSTSNLEELSLFHSLVGKDGIEELARSTHWPGLRRLSLEGTHLQPQGAAALAGAIGLGALTDLDLTDTYLGKAGVTAIAKSTAFPQLKRLALAGNELEEAATRPLFTGAGSWPNLKSIDFQDTNLTKFGPALVITHPVKPAGGKGWLPAEVEFRHQSFRAGYGVDFPAFMTRDGASLVLGQRLYWWESAVAILVSASTPCETKSKGGTPLAEKTTPDAVFFIGDVCFPGTHAFVSAAVPTTLAPYFRPIIQAMFRSIKSEH